MYHYMRLQYIKESSLTAWQKYNTLFNIRLIDRAWYQNASVPLFRNIYI